METALRVLINLTHDNVQWCQSVMEDPIALLTLVRVVTMSHAERMILDGQRGNEATTVDLGEDDLAAQSLDRLCLALGVLTNWIQNDRTAHISLQELSEYFAVYFTPHTDSHFRTGSAMQRITRLCHVLPMCFLGQRLRLSGIRLHGTLQAQ